MNGLRTSVAMTLATHDRLRDHLIRDDGQEDICLATYRPSTGKDRVTAIIREVFLPNPGERDVHGNASITGDYVLRVAALAHARGEGIVLVHSHPGGTGWQGMSRPDVDCELSYANLAREITGLPLVGMTLAGRDDTWSARHWDQGLGSGTARTDCDNVRVVGEQLVLSWNDERVPPRRPTRRQTRSVTCWGPRVHADLARRSVLVIGCGSVGLDVAQRLAATGLTRLGLMDFDRVEEGNLDRLIGASSTDVWLRRSKVAVAARLIEENATADNFQLMISDLSVCEEAGFHAALDYDLIVCCVDRPWPRAVLNALAYTDLIPVVDGGIAVDRLPGDRGMRNATWRSHVIRPGRPCLSCNGQLELGAVTADMQGLLEDSAYIKHEGEPAGGENVAILSVSATAAILAQFVSFNVAPGGIGDPGPLQYVLSTNTLEHLQVQSREACPFEAAEGEADTRHSLTGPHVTAERLRDECSQAALPWSVRLARVVDDALHGLRRAMRRRSLQALGDNDTAHRS